MANLIPLTPNNAYSTVQAGSSAIGSASATGINVATGDGAKFGVIGTNQFVPAVVVDTSTSPETVKEYVWVTSRSTDALTVVRQAEDSSRYAASTTSIQAGYYIAAVASRAGLLPMLGNRWFRAAGFYYAADASALTTKALFLGDLSFTSFAVANPVTLTRIGIEVTTSAAASSLVRLGIYKDSGGAPGALLMDAGTIDSSVTGAAEITISQALDPGLYWLSSVAQGTNAATVRAMTGVRSNVGKATFPTGSNGFPGYFASAYTGALPDPAPTVAPTTTSPYVLVKT